MRRATGLRMSSYVRVAGIVLIVAALATPVTGCVFFRYRPIPDPGPSLDLEIRTWHDLDAVRDNLAGHHRLMNDLDSTTAGYEDLAGPTADNGKGWLRLGTGHFNDPNFYLAFTGTFDGQGHEIRGLSQRRSAVGLFGYVAPGGVIENLAIVDATVIGHRPVAALAATNAGIVSNCSSSGNVTGDFSVGGLVGQNSGAVNNCYSRASVAGRDIDAGGLVGWNDGGSVSNSYATGSVTGGFAVGGLVGRDVGGTVSNSYATGPVIAPETSGLGGFVGYNRRGTIINCYSTGSVHYEGVADPTNKGFAGLVDTGDRYEMAGNFWDIETSGQLSTAGDATGRTTAEMMDIGTFTDTETEGLDEPWDMVAVADTDQRNPANVWNIVDGQTYPFLSWETVA